MVINVEIEEYATPTIRDAVLKIMENEKECKIIDPTSGYGDISYTLSKMDFEVYTDIDPSKFRLKNIKWFNVNVNKELSWND